MINVRKSTIRPRINCFICGQSATRVMEMTPDAMHKISEVNLCDNCVCSLVKQLHPTCSICRHFMVKQLLSGKVEQYCDCGLQGYVLDDDYCSRWEERS